MEDLAQVAESEGITIDEAIERYAWNQPFAVLVDKIRQSYPDEFAGSAIEAGDGYSAWVGFRDTAPVGALDLLAGFSRPIEVREGRSFTEAELEEATVRAHYALWDRQDLVENVSTYYEIRTGEILATVELRDSFRASVGNGDEARDRLVPLLPADVRDRVTVEVVDDLPGGTDTVYGGVRLSTCTTGFTVSSGSGRWVTTAGHCGNSQVYDGRLTIYFVKEHRGAWGDFQMHSASETKADDFYATPNSRRDVSSRGPLPTVLQPLCMNGKTTEKSLLQSLKGQPVRRLLLPARCYEHT